MSTARKPEPMWYHLRAERDRAVAALKIAYTVLRNQGDELPGEYHRHREHVADELAKLVGAERVRH